MKENFKKLKEENKKLWKAYSILMNYWDSLPDDEKPKIDKQLKKLGI